MNDKQLKEYYISELKKRNKSVSGTLRTLQKRYENTIEHHINANQNNANPNQNYINPNQNEPNVTNESLSEDLSSFWSSTFTPIAKPKPTNNYIPREALGSQSETIREFVFASEKAVPKKGPKNFKVYVGNLNYKMKKTEFTAMCSSLEIDGEISAIHFPMDGPNKNLGFAFVFFTCQPDGEKFISTFDQFSVLGRKLRVEKAHDKKISKSRMLRQLEKRIRQHEQLMRREAAKKQKEDQKKKKAAAKRQKAAARKKNEVHKKQKRNSPGGQAASKRPRRGAQ